MEFFEEKIIPIHRLRETDDDGITSQPTKLEIDLEILKRELPLLCNDLMTIVGKPFRLNWDPTTKTASTDCQAVINLSPWYFLNNRREEGYGSAYHEGGHIRFSPFGVKLAKRANDEGGQVLVDLVNLILDRKDDLNLAEFTPGFADRLRKRLLYICTMSREEELSHLYPEFKGDELNRLLRNFKPRDLYEDFFLAAKWHKTPRQIETKRAMKILRRKRLMDNQADEILYKAKRIREILGEPVGLREQQEQENIFTRLMYLSSKFENGSPGFKLSWQMVQALQQMVQIYVGSVRVETLKKLENMLHNMPMVHPGPFSSGKVESVPIVKVPKSLENEEEYNFLLQSCADLVQPLVRKLRQLDNPSEYTLYGQDEGELDLDEVANIATGLGGCYLDTVTERDIDLEMHLAIDNSGSMEGVKLVKAKQLATVFSEGLISLGDLANGNIWGFNSQAIHDFGPLGNQSGFVNLASAACNSDTHMLKYVGNVLVKSQRNRKVLLILCDDGPDDLQEAKQLAEQLWARGVIVIHLMIGVHGTPDIYPVELLYDSMDECLEEFGALLELIISNIK